MKLINYFFGIIIILIWTCALGATYLAEVTTYFILDRLPRLPLPIGDKYYKEEQC